jgi:hypothetical protein
MSGGNGNKAGMRSEAEQLLKCELCSAILPPADAFTGWIMVQGRLYCPRCQINRSK